jgi:hypothetical protein
LGFYLAYGDEDIRKLRSEISSEIGKGIFFWYDVDIWLNIWYFMDKERFTAQFLIFHGQKKDFWLF